MARIGIDGVVKLSGVNLSHLHDTSQESDGRGHENSLIVHGQALEPCDVCYWALGGDQPRHHAADHQTQDGERTCGRNREH